MKNGEISTSRAPKTVDLTAPIQESPAPTQESPALMLSEQPEFPDANDGGQAPHDPPDQRAGVSQFPAESQPPQV